ncbi:MAG: MFS transporter [Candidatus Helarchaeota archaeon]
MAEKSFSKSPFKGTYRIAIFRILITTFLLGIASLGIFMISFSRMISEILQRKLFYPMNVAAGTASILIGIDIFAKLAISPLAGYLADKYGRRKIVNFGIFYGVIGGLCFVWAYLVNTEIAVFATIISGIIILGMEKGQVNTAITIMSGDTGEEYDQIGKSEASWDVALILGLAVGVVLVELLKLSYFYAVILGVFIFSTALVVGYFLIGETLQPLGKKAIFDETKITIRSAKDVLKEKNFIPLFAYAFAVESIESGYFFTILPLLYEKLELGNLSYFRPLLEFFNIDVGGSILILFPAFLGLVIFFIPAGILSDKFGRRKTSLLGSFLSIFIMISLYWMRSVFEIIITLMIMGFFMCLYRMPLMASLTDLTDRKSRGIAYGILRGFREVGGSTAPIMFGILLLLGFDFYELAIFGAAIIAIAFGIAYFLFKETVRKKI